MLILFNQARIMAKKREREVRRHPQEDVLPIIRRAIDALLLLAEVMGDGESSG